MSGSKKRSATSAALDQGGIASIEVRSDLTDGELASHFLTTWSGRLRYHRGQDTLYMWSVERRLWAKSVGASQYMPVLRAALLETCSDAVSRINYDQAAPSIDRTARGRLLAKLDNHRSQSNIIHRLMDMIKASATDAQDAQLERDLVMAGRLPLPEGLVLDLATATTRPRERSDFFTHELPLPLLDEAKVDHAFVREYLGQVLSSTDAAYMDAFTQYMGYLLSGEGSQKVILLFVGPPDSGKSLLIRLLHRMLGPYFLPAVNPKVVTAGIDSCHESELFPLIGKRGGALSELEAHQRFNEARLKQISGQDALSMRGCGQAETHEATLNLTLCLMTNHVPRFSDDALASRLRVFSFHNHFERSSEKAAFIEDRAADLFYAFVQGARRFYEAGRRLPACLQIDRATTALIESKCSVRNWLSESGDYHFDACSGAEAKKLEMFQAYTKWSRDPANEAYVPRQLGRNQFYARIVELYAARFDEEKQNSLLVFEQQASHVYRGFVRGQAP